MTSFANTLAGILGLLFIDFVRKVFGLNFMDSRRYDELISLAAGSADWIDG